MGDVTLEEVIIEMMPFSGELLYWCKDHPEFFKALKNIYPRKFISLHAIVTSYPPNSEDEVIGIYSYDYQRRNPIFKQDFIVNKGRSNQEFILFTRNPKGSGSRYVKDINDFFAKYGKGGNYGNSHHLTLEELPDEIKERGKDAIRIAEKIKGDNLNGVPQEHIDKIHQELAKVKKGKWYIKKRLKNS